MIIIWDDSAVSTSFLLLVTKELINLGVHKNTQVVLMDLMDKGIKAFALGAAVITWLQSEISLHTSCVLDTYLRTNYTSVR